eukprot:5271854-Ditylum_brightwellii.AAC.1
MDDDREFPVWLVIPATHFTALFVKLRYMGIKKVFCNYRANYSKHTIVQNSDLKEKLEACKLKKDDITIIALSI